MIKILLSFLFCGLVCLIAQIILDHTKLTPGHITTIYVVLGSLLDVFSIYDIIVEKVGGGAMVPITSFGHQLTHATIAKEQALGPLGIVSGMFDLTASGITAAIIFAFFLSLIFKPKN